MQPRNLSILGVGLLGGSIALAAKRRITNCTVKGYGHREQTLTDAINAGVIDERYADASAAVRGADLIILCTPVGVFEQILCEIAPALAPGAVVTDVGSTKRSVVSAAERLLPPTVAFVGSHPMAGSEKRGVENARADLTDGALCIVTPTDRTPAAAMETVETFWKTIGMRTTRMSPADHDRHLADVSHLPHAVAAALVTIQEDKSIALAGKGFLDATRIAGGDGGLWRDILLDNRDNLRDSLLRLRGTLDDLLIRLEPEHAESLKRWLDDAAEKRSKLNRARRD